MIPYGYQWIHHFLRLEISLRIIRVLIIVKPHQLCEYLFNDPLKISMISPLFTLRHQPENHQNPLNNHHVQVQSTPNTNMWVHMFNLNVPWWIFMISLARLDLRILWILIRLMMNIHIRILILIRVMVNPHLCKNMSNDHRLSRTLMFHCLGNRVPSIRGYLRISTGSSSCE